jgi:hypothetical protein
VAAAEPLNESDLIELLEAQARRGSVWAIELLLARRAEAPGKMPPTEMIRSARSTSSPRSPPGSLVSWTRRSAVASAVQRTERLRWHRQSRRGE